MRTIFLQAWLAVGMLIGSLCASAQMPKIQRAEIKVPEAKCEACKTIIETIAPKYLDGLKVINVIWKRKVVLVQWYPDRTNIEEIKTAIANAGFDADDVTANPDAIKRLPDCCKKSAP
ncbi:MAG TPA: heavy-metal-associated domain-containing protein [Phnomibacter sp.]|nr:heavy-metal-associated domain-containing protein [Phnomibacter sp.]